MEHKLIIESDMGNRQSLEATYCNGLLTTKLTIPAQTEQELLTSNGSFGCPPNAHVVIRQMLEHWYNLVSKYNNYPREKYFI